MPTDKESSKMLFVDESVGVDESLYEDYTWANYVLSIGSPRPNKDFFSKTLKEKNNG